MARRHPLLCRKNEYGNGRNSRRTLHYYRVPLLWYLQREASALIGGLTAVNTLDDFAGWVDSRMDDPFDGMD